MITLSKESKSQLKRMLRKRIESLQATKIKEIDGSVKQQIETDKNEIKDIGIIICVFDNEQSPYDYIRTEPLFYFKNRNFDVLLYGNNTIILIDIKESLVSDTLSKINSLRGYVDDIEKNIKIHNTIEGKDILVLDYFKDIVKNDINNKEYVLASQKVHVQIVISKAKEAKYNFCLWKLLEKENKVFLFNERIVGDETVNFFAHKDTKLKDYIADLSRAGASYNDPLSFIFSSSCYLKSVNISIPLFKRLKNQFSYAQWYVLFATDLMNWHEKEKKTVYKNYIEYGINCKFIKCIKDKGDLFQNTYSIVSRHTKTDSLEKDIISKIIRFEVGCKIEENVPKIRKEIENELISKEAEQKGCKPLMHYFESGSAKKED